MRTRTFLLIAVIVGLTLNIACSGNQGVNLVDDIPARWDNLHQSEATKTMNTLKQMKVEGKSQAEMQAYLTEAWPTLANDIVAQLRMNNRLPGNDAVRVLFNFGSAKNVEADDANGVRHVGWFEDELVATVYPRSGGEPIDVIVRCLNGLFVIAGENLTLDGPGWSATPTMRFKIAQGKGLTTYVDYATSIDLAERFNLTLSARPMGGREETISPAEARRLYNQTDRVLVTVTVYPGDEFNLVDMTYTPTRGAVRNSR